MTAASAEILETLAGLIRQVIGEDWADDIDIGMETSFADDLELESIEFVQLAELLQNHYGKDVNFVSWLSKMQLDSIIGLKVGQVVEFVAQCQS